MLGRFKKISPSKKPTPKPAPKQKTLKLPNGKVITYLLDHRKRKTLGLKIDGQGLHVHAPMRMPLYQIETILLEKAHWVMRKLAQREANQVQAMQWEDGERLLFLGQEIQLAVSKHTRNKQPKLVNGILELALTNISPENVQYKVEQWYKKQALPDFNKRIQLYARQLGVPTPPVKLSNAKSRWGSCNSRGEIRLSWRLMQAPPEMINFVVCHELAHLKEMNHSPRFYAVLDGLFPKHLQVEHAMKLLTPQLHRMH